MAARVEEGTALLTEACQQARLLKQNLSGFEGTVSTFRTLGVLTRIETARLGNSGADFGHLADDVNLLAADVQTKIETALPAAALLIPSIESAIQNVAALEEGQTKDLPSVISRVLTNLGSFRDIEKQVADASARLAIAELHSSSERSVAQIAQIIARGARLSEDVSGTRRSLRADALFAEVISNSLRMLKEIEQANRSGLPHDRPEGREQGLADLAPHYTMQTERDVHDNAAKEVVGAAPAALPAEPKQAEKMGENVEFF